MNPLERAIYGKIAEMEQEDENQRFSKKAETHQERVARHKRILQEIILLVRSEQHY